MDATMTCSRAWPQAMHHAEVERFAVISLPSLHGVISSITLGVTAAHSAQRGFCGTGRPPSGWRWQPVSRNGGWYRCWGMSGTGEGEARTDGHHRHLC